MFNIELLMQGKFGTYARVLALPIAPFPGLRINLGGPDGNSATAVVKTVWYDEPTGEIHAWLEEQDFASHKTEADEASDFLAWGFRYDR